jgi:hypothetical protein
VQGQNPEWKIVAGRITSPWAEKVNQATPLPEFPLPQMVRNNWMSLNGLWNYVLVAKVQPENLPPSFSSQL